MTAAREPDNSPEPTRPPSVARPLRAVPTTPDPPGEDDLLDEPDHDPALAGWEPPVPLSPVRELPRFPLDALPGWVSEQVRAVAQTFQTPPDLPGCIALAALSAAAAGRAIVRVRAGWDEPINIYTVVVMPPSSRKSPPFRAMTAPLRDAERELVEASRAEREHARITRATAEKAMEKAEREAAGATSDQPGALAAAVDAALQAASVEIPPEPRLLADDLTPESAATLLAAHGGRLAVLSAEGGLFATLAGRYSGTPNLDVFLKGYSGDTHRVDRLGRPPEYIDRPAITLGLTVQPAIVDELRKTKLLRGAGLLARILYSLPPNTVGHRLSRPPAADPATAEDYANQLRGIALGLAGWTDPAVLQLTPAADDAMATYQDAIEPKLDPAGGEWASIGDWAGKLAGQTARLAGLLHIAEHPTEPWKHQLTDTTITAAQRFGDYFTAHALTVFDQLGTDPRIDDARHLLAWIERTRPARFTRREIYRQNRGGRFSTVTDIDPALAVLEDHGHIRLQPPERGGRGRTPSPVYLVHPTHQEGEGAGRGQNGHN
ncbi:YfjI family protein [Pseudonocardia acaciae]|uniref:YfjI family protein n=1 Tax=Pseudonocardia acaciae TaxID=551276 RepID=UPI00068568F1|nr:YfjI family protein [Pseudonocardia acaciae]